MINISDDDLKINLREIRDLNQIGEGASALVFKGKYNKDCICLKLFKPKTMDKSNISYEDFKKELELISKLKHQSIIGFLGFIVEKNKFGIVLEYCDNGSLESYLDNELNKNILSFETKLKILIGISKGMEYLHFKKIIHRDLKPDNILLTKDLNPKITDFGISKKIGDENSNTKTMKVGTSYYIAPEVVLTNNYSFKCDVFSFAIIMFKLLTETDKIYDLDKFCLRKVEDNLKKFLKINKTVKKEEKKEEEEIKKNEKEEIKEEIKEENEENEEEENDIQIFDIEYNNDTKNYVLDLKTNSSEESMKINLKNFENNSKSNDFINLIKKTLNKNTINLLKNEEVIQNSIEGKKTNDNLNTNSNTSTNSNTNSNEKILQEKEKEIENDYENKVQFEELTNEEKEGKITKDEIKEENEKEKEKENENENIPVENINEIELKDIFESNNDSDFNIELRVANDPSFRPFFLNKFTEKKKYKEFIELTKKCWKNNPEERPSFNEITLVLEEINENLK